MRTRHLYYVGPFSFPWGEAASRRVMGVASAIASCGHEVTVFPGRGVVGEMDAPAEVAGRVRVARGLDEMSGSRLRRSYQWAWGMGDATVARLESYPRPDVVIIYGGSFPYLRRILPWCRRQGIPVILDMVEWYDPTSFPGGKWGPIAASDSFARKIQHGRVDGVVAISTFLQKHYAGMGLPVALVPPTFVGEMGPPVVTPHDSLVMSYAGSPGAKDELGLIIRAFARVRRTVPFVELVIAGPTAVDVANLAGARSVPEGVQALGRIPQTEVLDLLCRSDYTVLLREDKRSSNAGFPTKFVESFRMGTPVIANITSDLGQYLRHGETGFVVDQLIVESVGSTLVTAASASVDDRQAMRAAVQALGQRFHWSNHAQALDELLRSVGG